LNGKEREVGLFLSLGALTTIIVVGECLIGGLADELRKPIILVIVYVGLMVSIFALPTVLFEPVLGREDFVFGQFWLVSVALLTCIFVTCNCYWGVQVVFRRRLGIAGMSFPPVYSHVMKWLLPLFMVILG
jgi:SNF family Na+-dependent transporter